MKIDDKMKLLRLKKTFCHCHNNVKLVNVAKKISAHKVNESSDTCYM